MQTFTGVLQCSKKYLGMILLMVPLVSCMKDAPESLPDRIEWNPVLAFPLGDENYGLNQVSGFDTTLLDLDTVTGLPAWVDEVTVVMQGNLDFGLSSIQENLDHLNGALFRVSCENGFPDVIYAQGYFEDEGENVIDSMFREGAMAVPAAKLNPSGELLETGMATQDSYFDRDRIRPLENASNIALRAFFIVTDPDSSLIPYYPTFQFDVHIGAMLDLTIEF
jgi:hypothetical protein